ncbi:hypothetical protein [Sulfitobacter aestuariivivens]|uniref:Argininosuccinate lyase n=1 Tax=Sulfitobacter aestuariivivens TaxID=2766981 RepID=A0A927D3H8_9RHOB|nr:hypothetical protein [Sulfitobacter aestuariivivens]MBD3662657.1 hypothetical protein [Sulfitobacter aestuariivivens]
MTAKILALFCAAALLSACGGRFVGPPPQPGMSDAYSNSVGFTGVSTTNS